MADGYYLNGDDVRVLRQIVDRYKRGEFFEQKGEGLPQLPKRGDVLFGVADVAIDGTTGTLTTPGSGTLNVYDFTSTGGTTVTTRDVTVYNLSSIARSTSEYTVAVRDYKSGNFMAVAGSGATSSSKKLCRFLLDAAMTTSDASGTGKITNQYGDGTAHSTSGTITVGNMLTAATSAYLFSGSSGAAGLAYWDSGTNWRILQMECP